MARRQNRTEEEYEPTESGFSKQEKGDPELQREREEKLKALEAARLQIEKQFGQGALMKLGAHTIAQGIEVIPSGSILLDEALGIGGYPRGRIIEIYGPESSGKTTLALHAIAEDKKKGGIAAFMDQPEEIGERQRGVGKKDVTDSRKHKAGIDDPVQRR